MFMNIEKKSPHPTVINNSIIYLILLFLLKLKECIMEISNGNEHVM